MAKHYPHIDNLYKNQSVLLFKEVYALEKIDGTSAHIKFMSNELVGSIIPVSPMGTPEQHSVSVTGGNVFEVFSGGATLVNFRKLFDAELPQQIANMGIKEIAIHGELYGPLQGMSARYGKELKFVVFDVRVNQSWLCVPQAEELAQKLGFEFASWVKIPSTVEACDAARDAPSVQARRNGIDGDQPTEGVILRPLTEFHDNRGERVIAKHKRPESRETATERKVSDGKVQVLADAVAIANEWVTEVRLDHILDQLPGAGIEKTGDVVKAMVADVLREGAGEIVDSREARTAISQRARILFHARLTRVV